MYNCPVAGVSCVHHSQSHHLHFFGCLFFLQGCRSVCLYSDHGTFPSCHTWNFCAASLDHFCTVWCLKCNTPVGVGFIFCLCNAFNLIYFLTTMKEFCFLCLLKCWMLKHVYTSVRTSFHHLITVPLEMLGAHEQNAKLHTLHVRTACLMQEMSWTAGCIHAAVETWYILNVKLPGRGENWHVAAHLIWQHTVSAPALSVDLPQRCRWWRGVWVARTRRGSCHKQRHG